MVIDGNTYSFLHNIVSKNKINWRYLKKFWEYATRTNITLDRAPVSMGAVGASAPMLFKVVGASTHTFWQLFLL